MAQVTSNSDLIIRTEVYSQQLKDILLDVLEAQKWVNWFEFPDGDQFTIPTVGQAHVTDYVEDELVKYEALDTGEWTFQVTEYKQSGNYITNKLLQDSFWGPRVKSEFVPKQARALMEVLETDILRTPSPNAQNTQGAGGQTTDDSNNVNSFAHRWNATGTNQEVDVTDFAYAGLALTKANVPTSNRIAIVDPITAFHLETTTNITNISNNPHWEGIVTSGLTTGMRFIRNVYGFDVFESNYLHRVTAAETFSSNRGSGSSLAGTAGDIQNLLFSADSSVNPIWGSWRQAPRVDGEYNKDRQREEMVTTARYGLKLYRPENMICVLSTATA